MKQFRYLIGAVSASGIVLAFTSFFVGKTSIYEKWAGLGGGTLYQNGKIAIFGDLSHLTSAAMCDEEIVVGTDVCDPWGRIFNQNPNVAELFRALGLTSVNVIGITSLIILYSLLFTLIWRLRLKSITPYLFSLTPVSILAIDRGNEVITLILILIGFFALQSKTSSRQILGALSLLTACIFKLWPIFLICFMLIFFWRKVTLIPKCILFFSVFYWVPRIGLVIEMLNSTDSGYPSGYSFGLQLTWHNQLSSSYRIVLVILTVLLLFTYIRMSKSSLEKFILNPLGARNLCSMLPVMLTFSVIWAVGDSYIYRMLILCPILLLLAQFNTSVFAYPRFLSTALILTCIVSLTPAVLVFTSALALYFLYLTVIIISNHRNLKSISQ